MAQHKQQQQYSNMFLTIDHLLALRRRNIGGASSNGGHDNVDYDYDSSSSMTNKMESKSINHISHDELSSSDMSYDNQQQPMTFIENVKKLLKYQRLSPLKLMESNNSNSGNMIIRRLLVQMFMIIFIGVVQVYTWTTLPIYFLMQKPWVKSRANNHKRVLVDNQRLNQSDQSESTKDLSPVYSRNDSGEYNHPIFKYDSLIEIIDNLPSIHGGDNPCLGFRKVLSAQASLDADGREKRMDGRQLRQYNLSDYKWFTYSQVNDIVNNLSQGLLANGIDLQSNKPCRCMMIAETRIEWMLCFQSLLRCGVTIVTVFSNLGVDGVACAIEETEIETVIVSIECLKLLQAAMKQSHKHNIKRIIYFDESNRPDLSEFNRGPNDNLNNIQVFALSEIEKQGKSIMEAGQQQMRPYPTPDIDRIALIMYTSGTTGTPKAATMSQRQFIAAIKALFVLVRHIVGEAPTHTYISYLPMAHVLELTLELFFLVGGVKLGYASPFTLTDSAPGLAPGVKSDIRLLKPTIMTTVPLVLERILKEVNEKLRSRTPISQPVFQYLMDYKSKWTQAGYSCGIITKLLCSKVREQLGGHLRFVICGGAPLNSNTQSIIKSALDVTLLQGYGATETTGACMCMDFDELDYGRVGAPLGQVYFRLRDWPDGGYSIRDQPNPRGEILIGGDLVAMDYFNRPELTAEVFITDQSGIRWFQTGDIGEMYPNGTVKIIDRCKDLIKLQNGEYISLGKVEAALKYNQYVDNVCVYGGTFSNDIVAIICPNRKSLQVLASTLGKQQFTVEKLCVDPQINEIIFDDIQKTARQLSLGKKEIPKRILLVSDVWSPDNGILTAALKLKRRIVEQVYKQQLFDLYDSDKFKDSHSNNHNNNNIKTKVTNGYDQNNNKVENTLAKTAEPYANGTVNGTAPATGTAATVSV